MRLKRFYGIKWVSCVIFFVHCLGLVYTLIRILNWLKQWWPIWLFWKSILSFEKITMDFGRLQSFESALLEIIFPVDLWMIGFIRILWRFGHLRHWLVKCECVIMCVHVCVLTKTFWMCPELLIIRQLGSPSSTVYVQSLEIVMKGNLTIFGSWLRSGRDRHDSLRKSSLFCVDGCLETCVSQSCMSCLNWRCHLASLGDI